MATELSAPNRMIARNRAIPNRDLDLLVCGHQFESRQI